MNTQKQITLMVALVFVLLGGCAAYSVYDQPREESALAAQQAKLANRGALIFARYCRQCHGNAGEGRIGPAIANATPYRDPDHLAENTIWITDTINCGRVGKVMPPWSIREGGALNDEQIRDLVTLITTNAGDGWSKAAEYSAEENKLTNGLTPIDQILPGAAITGATTRVCGQLAPPTATPPTGDVPSDLKAAASWTEDATDNKFSVTAMASNAGQPVTVNFNNKGAAIHNWEILGADGKQLPDAAGKAISLPLTDGGKSATITFTIATPGVYKFQCQVHPADMIGQFYVIGPDGKAK